jgi:hypothetical protein
MNYSSPQGLASLGRNGDSMLVHMSPSEVAGLQGLAMSQGGSLTINPETGLPEAFKLGNFFKSLLPTLVGAGFGFTAAPLWAGIAAGAATGAVTNRENPLMGAALGGLGGYGGMGIGSALKNTMAIVNPATTAPAVTQSAVSGIGPGALGTTGEIGGANLIGSGIAGGTAGTNAAATNIMGAMKNAGVNIADPLAQDATKQALQTIPKTSNLSGINMDPTSSFLKPTVFDPSYGTSVIQPSGTGAGSTLLGDGVNLSNSAASAQNPLIAASMSNSPTPGFMDTFVDQLGGSSAAMKKLGLPVGGAVLGGLEPSDLYGEPIKPKENKYDPYATLNLGNDTGLRLVAKGGYIKGYALGGAVNTNPSVGGGLSDLYNRPEGATTQTLSNDGYGIGRLNNLAGEQSMYQAQTLGYAMGGPVSFADGGITDEIAPINESIGIASLAPAVNTPATSGQTIPAQQVQNTAAAMSGPGSSDGSIISQVTNKLQQDPNYQPQNPIEAAIVKQIKGTDQTQQPQQAQGLGSIAPSQPMAPSYNPSVAMGPTYYAGMNRPQGYADGGDVVAGEKGMNLDALSAFNLNLVGAPSKDVDNMGGRSLYNGSRVKLYPMNFGGKTIYNDTPPMPFGRFGGVRNATPEPKAYALNLNTGRQEAQYARGGYLNGDGDGMSDSIPATIEGKQPARLADGEFVIPADVVSHLGNGSSKAGSKRLYAMLDKVRQARTGSKKQGKQIKAEKYLPA